MDDPIIPEKLPAVISPVQSANSKENLRNRSMSAPAPMPEKRPDRSPVKERSVSTASSRPAPLSPLVKDTSRAKHSPKDSPREKQRADRKLSSTSSVSSTFGEVVFGKRSETSPFEIQMRKMVAGLGITTKSGRKGEVLVKAPGKSSDIR